MRIASRILPLVAILSLAFDAGAGDLPPRPPPAPPVPPVSPLPPVPPPPPTPPPPTREAGRLGFQPRRAEGMSAADRQALGITAESGNVVVDVTPGGPAALAGLKVGDVILAIGDAMAPTDERADAWWASWRAVMAKVLVGDVVVIRIRVDAVKVRLLEATAIDTLALEHLRADAAAKATGPLPSLASAEGAAPFTEDFEQVVLQGAIPAGFFPARGRWSAVPDPTGVATNHVLRQDQEVETWTAGLLAGPHRALADGTISVRFCCVSGREDASAGIILRAQDAKNYYLVRANALEGNFRIYSMKDDVRWQLAGIEVIPPDLGTWHTLEVTLAGPKIRATLDGKNPVEVENASFASGWCGLWTKADSVTLFDDVRVELASPKPAR